MAKNRLKLDFSLQYNDERTEFLHKYLQSEMFIKFPPTEDELNTMGNYLLWGKDRKTGLNAKQMGIEIPTKSGDWSPADDRWESLDALMEQPTFNEATLRPMDSAPTRVKKEVFSREEALRRCPDSMREQFVSLFRQIDETELKINYYELAHNRRINPPRSALLEKFGGDEQKRMQELVSHWNQFTYLKQRHNLVELRRQQYTLRDAFVATMMFNTPPSYQEEVDPVDFGEGIEVLPLGLWGKGEIDRLVFGDWDRLIPGRYNGEQLKKISDFYWKKTQFAPDGNLEWFDFRELEHVYELFQMYYELKDGVDTTALEENTSALMRTLEFYIEGADLTDLQKEILDKKLKKEKNTDIAFEVNKKYGKSYTPNYISTIFRQRIIPKINDAASYHLKVVGNLWFPEEFKTCTGCGRILLRDAENFTRKTRSKDGFTTRCKRCEKMARNKGVD